MTTANERLVTLDGLRGVAVLGILLMNVNAFAMPFAAYDNPANYGPMRWPDILLWAVEFVMVDGKLRAIFSALFGASLLLVAEGAEAAGRSGTGLSLARLGTLLLFGLAHACLIWAGDILVLYALVGFVALALRRLPVERLLVLGLMLLVAQALILGSHYQALAALRDAAALPRPESAAIALWRDLIDQIGRPSPPALAADLALHHGGWRTLATALAAREPATILAELLFTGPETLGLMLLGMVGLKSGFLAGRWPPARYARLARAAYLIGCPPLAAMAAFLVVRGFPPLLTATLTDLAAMPLRWLVALGHSAVLVRWLAGGASPLKERLTAAGRAAFSNYLGTSLVMTALFEGWGLGLYGRIERWALLPIVVGAWALMLGWSGPWLAHFRHGPLEWLWRSMARGRIVPLRRVAIAKRSHLS